MDSILWSTHKWSGTGRPTWLRIIFVSGGRYLCANRFHRSITGCESTGRPQPLQTDPHHRANTTAVPCDAHAPVDRHASERRRLSPSNRKKGTHVHCALCADRRIGKLMRVCAFARAFHLCTRCVCIRSESEHELVSTWGRMHVSTCVDCVHLSARCAGRNASLTFRGNRHP
jgi:hypothetical protein